MNWRRARSGHYLSGDWLIERSGLWWRFRLVQNRSFSKAYRTLAECQAACAAQATDGPEDEEGLVCPTA